jgi:hypothetical protein
MPSIYNFCIGELTRSCRELFRSLAWRDFVGIFSLLAYLLISILILTNIKDDLQGYDSTMMLKMARGEEDISSTLGPPYILFLRFMINTFGDSALFYLHYFVAAITGLVLVSIFGRRHLFSWSGLWILAAPSYLILNQMIWRDVPFLYLISIAVALIIKADRDKTNIRNTFAVITALLTAICLVRLNGLTVAGLMIGAFCINKTNIRAKLISLGVALALALSTNTFINNHYPVVQSQITTKYMLTRMVENDYLYYVFCVSHEGLSAGPDSNTKISVELNQACYNSYDIDAVKRSLTGISHEEIFQRSTTLFSQKPSLWLLVKYKQANQYLNMDGAFVFPSSVIRLDFLNAPEFKEKSAYHEAIAIWMNHSFSTITHFTFQPLWIVIFALYIAIRGTYLKFILSAQNATQSNILMPSAIFGILFYMSLAFPSMANDTRYFLPATFLSLFMLLNVAFSDLRSLAAQVIAKATRNRKAV